MTGSSSVLILFIVNEKRTLMRLPYDFEYPEESSSRTYSVVDYKVNDVDRNPLDDIKRSS